MSLFCRKVEDVRAAIWVMRELTKGRKYFGNGSLFYIEFLEAIAQSAKTHA